MHFDYIKAIIKFYNIKWNSILKKSQLKINLTMVFVMKSSIKALQIIFKTFISQKNNFILKF
jgi:hypothetical protein